MSVEKKKDKKKDKMPRTHWFKALFQDDSPDTSSTTFRVYSYRYRCGKWYGWSEGMRSVVVDTKDDTAVKDTLRKDAAETTGSGDCSVTLLQVYDMMIQNIRPFSALGFGVQPSQMKQQDA